MRSKVALFILEYIVRPIAIVMTISGLIIISLFMIIGLLSWVFNIEPVNPTWLWGK